MSFLFFICWTCTSLYSFVYIYQHYKSIPSRPSSNQTSQWKIPCSWMISPSINYKPPFSLGISIQPPCLMTLETNTILVHENQWNLSFPSSYGPQQFTPWLIKSAIHNSYNFYISHIPLNHPVAGVIPFPNQWPFQQPKLEVPTIYQAYIRPMVQYLQFRILKFPLNFVWWIRWSSYVDSVKSWVNFKFPFVGGIWINPFSQRFQSDCPTCSDFHRENDDYNLSSIHPM